MQARCFNCARIDCVDTNLAWTQFLREGSCHCIYGRLAGAINGAERWRKSARNRADVDNATAFRAEKLDRLLRSKKHTEHIEIEVLIKMFFVDLLEGTEFIDPRIVNEDIQLAESFLCFVKKAADFRRYGHVGLYGDCFPPSRGDVRDDGIGACFAGCVIDDDGGTLRGKMFCDGSADAFRAPVTSATWPASFWDITFPSISGDSLLSDEAEGRKDSVAPLVLLRLAFSGLPIASKKMALFPFACGEKKAVTSSSKKVSPVEPRRWAYAARYILPPMTPASS